MGDEDEEASYYGLILAEKDTTPLVDFQAKVSCRYMELVDKLAEKDEDGLVDEEMGARNV